MTTRNQLDRLIAIHDRLSTGLHYSLTDLMDACEARTGQRPSEKTLYNDLRRLKDEYNAPIPERNRSEKPYYYTDRGFSLYAVLNPQDAALANEAAALLKQVSHLPQFAGLEDVFLKFEQRATTMGNHNGPTIQFEQNPGYTGLRWLSQIYEAMNQDRPLWIVYKPFIGEASTLSFSPYLLKEYSNRWHVYGYGAESIGLNSLALDRIDFLKIRPDLIRQVNTRNWEDYLADVVGFTRLHSEPVENWVIRVYKPRAYYVLTKPLHSCQEVIIETDQYIDFRYLLRWNRELDSKLLELGPDAELLEPLDKRAAFADKVNALMARYSSDR